METVKVADLITVAIIAERTGVDYRTIHQWRQRFKDFPAPVAGNVYHWPNVQHWLKEHGRALASNT